jgi:hypothetical protein
MGTAVAVERDGRLTGYASGLGYFAHAAAESNAALKTLLAAGDNYGGPGIIVPIRNAEVFRWCLETGYRVLHPMTLMTIGQRAPRRRSAFRLVLDRKNCVKTFP